MWRPDIQLPGKRAPAMLKAGCPVVVSPERESNRDYRIRVLRGYVGHTATDAEAIAAQIQAGALPEDREPVILAFDAADPRAKTRPGGVLFAPDFTWCGLEYKISANS